MVQYSQDLPEIYQNFQAVAGVADSEVGQLGSSVTLADFCPYIQEFTWRGGGEGEEGRGTRCGEEDNAPRLDNNYALETYGQGSRCFRQVRAERLPLSLGCWVTLLCRPASGRRSRAR